MGLKFTAGEYKVEFDYNGVNVDVTGNIPTVATNPHPDSSIEGHTMVTTIEFTPSK